MNRLLAILITFFLAGSAAAQGPVLIQEVISREVGLFVGDGPNNQVISREVGIFVGDGPNNQVISREYSLNMVDAAPPPIVTAISMTVSPSGHTVTMDWSSYNQWAVRDVDHYAVYYSTSPFADVSSMGVYTNVPGEQLTLTLTGLPEWQDHFFAVVPVDGLGNFNPVIQYRAAYVLIPQVISREVGIFVGDGPNNQVISREYSINASDAAAPPIVTSVNMTVSPSGHTVTLDWSAYNQYGVRDVDHYAIYYSPTGPFTNVTAMTPFRIVRGESFTTTFTNLVEWQDHYFAVVPVDGLGNFNPAVQYSAAYVLMPQVISREVGLFVGDGPNNQVISREVSVVVGSTNVPDAVTYSTSPFGAVASKTRYGGIDLDWSFYNEWAQRDVVRYRIYMTNTFFNSVVGMPVYAYSANGSQKDTITGLACEQIYHVAVVAEDTLGNFNPVVYSTSSKASVCQLGDVANLSAVSMFGAIALSWDLGGVGTDLASFVDHFHVYIDNSPTPVVVSSNLRSWAYTGLSDSLPHRFRVTTVDLGLVESAGQSVTASASVLPGATGPVRRWDTVAGDGGGITDGAGTWTNNGGNWNNGGANVNWSNTTPDYAYFGNGGTGSSLVTLGGPITAAGLYFAQGPTYTITSNTLTLSGTPHVRVDPGVSAIVSSAVAGSAPVTVKGGGRLRLGGGNSLNAGFRVAEGVLECAHNSALGSSPAILGTLATSTNHVALYVGPARTSLAGSILVSSNALGEVVLGSLATTTGTGDNNFMQNIVLQRDVILDSNAPDRTDYRSISGVGNVKVRGSRRTIFSAVNSFTGKVTVDSAQGGYLQVGMATAGNTDYIPNSSDLEVLDDPSNAGAEFRLSSGGETINRLLGNGRIDVNSINGVLTVGAMGGSSDFEGALVSGGGGTLGLTKIGAGMLTLSGTNTLAGVVRVSAGTTRIAASGFLSLAGGAIVDGTNAVLEIVGTVASSGGATSPFDIKNGGRVFFSGTGSVNNSSGGILVGNGGPGEFRMTGGTLSTTWSNTNGWGIGWQNNGNGTLSVSGGVLTPALADDVFYVGYGANNAKGVVRVADSGVLNLGAGGGVVFVGGGASGSGQYGSGTMTIANGGLVSVAPGGVFPADRFYLAAYGGNGTLNLDTGGVLVTAREFGNGGAGTINASGGTLRLTTNTVSLVATGINLNLLSGGLTIDTQSFTSTLPRATAGPGDLRKAGPGTLILTGANGHAGRTLVEAGTLQVGAGGTTGSLGAGAVEVNGALVFNFNNTATATLPAAGISGPGSVTATAKNLVFNGPVTTGGNQTYSATANSGLSQGGHINAPIMALTTTGPGASISLSGDFGKAASTGNSLMLDTSAGAGDISLNISLCRLNVWYGLTQFSANAGTGRVRVTGTGPASAGWRLTPVVLTGAIEINTALSTTDPLTLNATAPGLVSGNLSGTARLTKGGPSTLRLAGVNTYTGKTEVNAGVLEVSGSVAHPAQDVDILNGGTLHLLSGTLTASATRIRAGGILSGCGTINGPVVNDGTLAIDCVGGLTVNGSVTNNGRMRFIGGTRLLGASSVVNNGILDLITGNQTLPANLVNNGTVLLSGSVQAVEASEQGGVFSVSIASQPGHAYQLQRAENLPATLWTNIGPAQEGTGADLDFTDPNPGAAGRRYYRFKVEP